MSRCVPNTAGSTEGDKGISRAPKKLRAVTREYAEQMLKAILRPGHRIYVLPRRSRFGNSRFRLFAAEDNVIAELTKYVAAALNVPCSRGGIFVRCSGDEVIRSMVETLGFVLYGDATAFVMRTL